MEVGAKSRSIRYFTQPARYFTLPARQTDEGRLRSGPRSCVFRAHIQESSRYFTLPARYFTLLARQTDEGRFCVQDEGVSFRTFVLSKIRKLAGFTVFSLATTLVRTLNCRFIFLKKSLVCPELGYVYW